MENFLKILINSINAKRLVITFMCSSISIVVILYEAMVILMLIIFLVACRYNIMNIIFCIKTFNMLRLKQQLYTISLRLLHRNHM